MITKKTGTLLIALALIIGNMYVIYVKPREWVISGESMSPIFHDGDRIRGVRTCFRKLYDTELSRWNIVMVDIQEFKTLYAETINETMVIKTILGMPGDHIVFEGSGVYVNDELVCYPDLLTDNIDIVLKENEYFIVGLNSGASFDSRVFGPVKEKNICYIFTERADGSKVDIKKEMDF